MLQQKLEDASKAAHRRRMWAIAAVVGAALFVGLFVSGVITLDFSLFSRQPAPVTARASAPKQPMALSSEASRTEAKTELNADKSQVNQAPKLQADAGLLPQSQNSSEPQVVAINVEELRETFKDELGDFEERLKPEIESPEFKQWNAAGFAEIQSTKDAAISAFSSANYKPAIEKIITAKNLAEKLVQQRDAELAQALSLAAQSLQNDDYEGSLIEIGKALLLKPSSKEVASLKSKIDRLPEVRAAIEKAAVARTENNLEAELKNLAAVLKLEPDRPGVSERYAEVDSLIKEDRFSKLVQAGLDSIEKRDLSAAQASLKQARTIFASRSELNVLANRADNLRKELDAEQLIAEAVKASKNDDWVAAEKLFKDAGKVLPNNKDASDGAQLAGTINEYRIELAKHLSSPHRLSSSNVSEIVIDLIANAEVYGAFSPSLASQAARLKELQSSYATPVSITVLSDGETKVTVRGVGIVGTTKLKVIQLKPGPYIFEGARPGYQSKLVNLEVLPGAEKLTVKVICDERI